MMMTAKRLAQMKGENAERFPIAQIAKLLLQLAAPPMTRRNLKLRIIGLQISKSVSNYYLTRAHTNTHNSLNCRGEAVDCMISLLRSLSATSFSNLATFCFSFSLSHFVLGLHVQVYGWAIDVIESTRAAQEKDADLAQQAVQSGQESRD